MKIKTISWVVGAFVLVGCSAVPGLSNGGQSSSLDSYFATSVGKAAGHAQALAAACPSLGFKQAELDIHRVAICRGGGLADDCSVPKLAAATEQSFTETMALLSGMTPAEACTKANAEIANDSVLAEYVN